MVSSKGGLLYLFKGFIGICGVLANSLSLFLNIKV